MSALVWKLLRQHISIGQLAGFFLANLFGMMIVLLSVQFYKDVIPVFTKGDSFMKKTLIVGILLTTLLLGGCTSQIKKEDPLTSENMKYSTMSDEDTQKKVSDFLSKNNIDKKDISMFMQSVQHHYKSVEGVELLNENERLSKMQVPYNLYDLSDKWIENNPNFTDQNCRITAFRLFNKFITSNSSLDYDKIDNTNLEMDYATLRDNPDAKFSKEDMNKFFNFFSNIKVSDFNDVKKSADEIAKEAEFFSFGTNDLTQMTFGFSRDDAGKFLDAYYQNKIYEIDPFAKLDQVGVGQLVKMAAEKGRAGKPESGASPGFPAGQYQADERQSAGGQAGRNPGFLPGSRTGKQPAGEPDQRDRGRQKEAGPGTRSSQKRQRSGTDIDGTRVR